MPFWVVMPRGFSKLRKGINVAKKLKYTLAEAKTRADELMRKGNH